MLINANALGVIVLVKLSENVVVVGPELILIGGELGVHRGIATIDGAFTLVLVVNVEHIG